MEAEVVSMCINMFNGDSNCCGVVSEQMLKTKELNKAENILSRP